MSVIFHCKKCNELDNDLSSDINKLIDKANETEVIYRDRVLYNSNFSEATTKHWMSEYNRLLTRHNKTMENKAKHLNKMKQACYDKLALQNEYIDDLEKTIMMYRKQEKERYSLRRIK